MFGGRIDHHIGAELQRLLEDRGGEDIIDHHLGPDLLGQGADGGDVGHLQQRIGRAFDEEHLGVGPHGRAPGGDVRPRHQAGLDAESRRPIVEDPAAGAEHGLGAHQMIAGPQQSGQGQVHRRHARGRAAAGLRAFQQGQPVLEHLHRRIGVARIDKARVVAGEAPIGGLGAVIDEALGQIEGFGGFAIGRARQAAPDQPGGGLPALRVFAFVLAGHVETSLHKAAGIKGADPTQVKAARQVKYTAAGQMARV